MPAADLNQGAGDPAHHVIEKAVRLNIDEEPPLLGSNLQGVNRSNRRGNWPSAGMKKLKVAPPRQVLCGLLHGMEI